MQTRRQHIQHSAVVASLLAGTGLFPQFAHAAFNKAAFDAKGLLNPEKNIPSLHRCAEYGKMHVRQGQMKFADLPRF